MSTYKYNAYFFNKLIVLWMSDAKMFMELSVSHRGARDITPCLMSEIHRRTDRAAASSSSMFNFFKNSNAPSSKYLYIATATST